MDKWFLLLCFSPLLCQALNPGDIAIVSFDANTDQFAFVALVDLPEGEQIIFTDKGWLATGSFRSGEGVDYWSVPSGGISCGSIVRLTAISINLATTGDQLFAFQGDISNPQFITGLQYNNTSWDGDALDASTSAIPEKLTNGYTAGVIPEPGNDVANYKGALSFVSSFNALESIYTLSNWEKGNTIAYNPPNDFILNNCTGLLCDISLTLNARSCSADDTAYTASITFDLGTMTDNFVITASSGTVSPTMISASGMITISNVPNANNVRLTVSNERGCVKILDIARPICEAPPIGSLVITEIMYDPYLVGTDTADEWVEIFNVTTENIDLTGYSIGDDLGFANLSGTIPARSIAIISRYTSSAFNAKWATSALVIPITGVNPKFGNTGDEVIIRDAFGRIQDEVHYQPPFPINNAKASIYFNAGDTQLDATSHIDNDAACNWYLSMPTSAGAYAVMSGSGVDIGSPNSVFQKSALAQTGEIVITEIFYNPNGISPTNEAEQEFIELKNTTANSIDVTGWQVGDLSNLQTMVGVIAPFGLTVVSSQSETNFNQAWTNCACPIEVIQVANPFYLGNNWACDNARIVQLFNASGDLVDEVNYDFVSPWTIAPNGQSIALKAASMHSSQNDIGSNWPLASMDPNACNSQSFGIFQTGNQASPGVIEGQGFIACHFADATLQDGQTICLSELPALSALPTRDDNSVLGTWRKTDHGGVPQTMTFEFEPSNTTCFQNYAFTVTIKPNPTTTNIKSQ